MIVGNGRIMSNISLLMWKICHLDPYFGPQTVINETYLNVSSRKKEYETEHNAEFSIVLFILCNLTSDYYKNCYPIS